MLLSLSLSINIKINLTSKPHWEKMNGLMAEKSKNKKLKVAVKP